MTQPRLIQSRIHTLTEWISSALQSQPDPIFHRIAVMFPGSIGIIGASHTIFPAEKPFHPALIDDDAARHEVYIVEIGTISANICEFIFLSTGKGPLGISPGVTGHLRESA